MPPARRETADAIRLLSAVADSFGGMRIGFSLHVADVAAGFAMFAGRPPAEIAAAYHAAALHGLGAVSVVVPRDAGPREAEVLGWDRPVDGARLVARFDAFSPATADAIRWHREAFDGTGFPDRLRWNGIPRAAMELNVARAFVAALEEQAEQGGSPADALFTLVDAAGSTYSLDVIRAFRTFISVQADALETAVDTPPADFAQPREAVADVCRAIDARAARSRGRGDRVERIVRAIGRQLGDDPATIERTAFAARLTSIARRGGDGSADSTFTLSRLGLDSRAAQARIAASIVAVAPAYADLAPVVASVEEWYDGSGLPDGTAGESIDPVARRVAVAQAAEAVNTADAAQRLAAAAGKRLDPAIVDAYFAAKVAR